MPGSLKIPQKTEQQDRSRVHARAVFQKAILTEGWTENWTSTLLHVKGEMTVNIKLSIFSTIVSAGSR